MKKIHPQAEIIQQYKQRVIGHIKRLAEVPETEAQRLFENEKDTFQNSYERGEHSEDVAKRIIGTY